MGHYDTCRPDRCSCCGGSKHADGICPHQPTGNERRRRIVVKAPNIQQLPKVVNLWCPVPECSKPIAATERRPNGDSICVDGHKCKTEKALRQQPKRRFELESEVTSRTLASWAGLIKKLTKEHGSDACMTIEAAHEDVSVYIEKY